MIKGEVILLNGVSSSGKSTIATMLSERLPNYFVLGFDDLGDLISKMRNYKKDPSTWSIINNQNYDLHFITFILHRLTKVISEYSFNIIIDTVLDAESDAEDFLEQFKDEDVLYVGVHCPLEELERRERVRGDRNIGIAKEQLEIVHKHMKYDVEINTYENSTEECVSKILAALSVKPIV
ncbi:AAA family ATPase [Paenibacillus sp. OV219]|uniref:phosphotransferase-like protein n=1 Tax=Paenibacillus sp. OV219 TaxID=1884377 RepID=UPI0008D1D0A0|nr:AAA family ATPase [Paenibacillus sp. OV219]SEO88917.1 chloramphenicol 3-O phosphotransferase [Paenibacillus sp. OV219]